MKSASHQFKPRYLLGVTPVLIESQENKPVKEDITLPFLMHFFSGGHAFLCLGTTDAAIIRHTGFITT